MSSICEKYFCIKHFPEFRDSLEEAYSIYGNYLELDKKLDTALPKSDKELKALREAIQVAESLKQIDPSFEKYLSSSKSHTLVRQKALSKIPADRLEAAKPLLEKLKELELILTETSLQKILKKLYPLTHLKSELKKTYDKLVKTNPSCEKYLHSIRKTLK